MPLFFPKTQRLSRDGLSVHIYPEGPHWVKTDAAGSWIIENCSGLGEEEIARRLGEEFGGSPEDVERFLRGLVEAGFASREPIKEAPYEGRGGAIGCLGLRELWIYTNNSCNLRCRHCFLSAGDYRREELSKEELLGLVDEARGLGVTRIYLTGGEPFLRKDILELIREITVARRLELVILTNGTLLEGTLLEGLARVKSPSLHLQVSLEGPSPEVNDTIRGEGSFHRILAGLTNLLTIGITPVVTTTATRLNIGHLEETMALLASMGIKDHHILWLHPRGRAQGGDLSVSAEELAAAMEKLQASAKRRGLVVDNIESLRLRVRGGRGRKNDLCNACYEALSVDSDGRVYPCAPLNGAQEFLLGSTKERTLKEIWLSSPRAEELRTATVMGKRSCRSCPYRHLCGGGCYCQAYYSSGSIMAEEPYCAAYRRIIENILLDGGKGDGGGPRLYAAMKAELPACALPSTRVLDFSHRVGTTHCTCFLAGDAEGLGPGRGYKPPDACFNERAGEYDRWYATPLGRAYGEEARKAITPHLPERGSALDVGCGTGFYTLFLARRGLKTVGVDASEAMLRIALEKAQRQGVQAEFRHAPAEELPFPPASFDLVLSMNMLEFSRAPEKALAEMLRVLRPHGTLLLGAMNRQSLWGMTQRLKRPFVRGVYYDARFYTRGELRAMLPGAEIEEAVFLPPINFATCLGPIFRLLPGALLVARVEKA